ncbi:hypothetical protein, partial [Salmonella enterica]|uniref:hypothetical protein n=1 Tax=Salmonella enterica TaxID=28901 RepID=UPI001C636F1C
RGCNPTSSKFIHTWLRFGEIMRGSLSVLWRYRKFVRGRAIFFGVDIEWFKLLFLSIKII